MKSTTLLQAALGCMTVSAGALLPHHGRLSPRHLTTKTVLVTVSLGPSGPVTLGGCSDGQTSSSSPTPIVSTIALTTEITTTIIPTPIPVPATSIFNSTATTPSPLPSSISTSTTTSLLLPSSSFSSAALPDPAPTFAPEPNYITAPATNPNPILAQNAADAQALNRQFRETDLQGRCDEGAVGCVADVHVRCTGKTWIATFCQDPKTKCRAVPRMQTNGVVLGCYADADVLARISSTGQPGDAFGE